VDSFITFGLKRLATGPGATFPVALDLPQEPTMALGVAIMPSVTRDRLDDAMACADELSHAVYRHGGRRYLYGVHRLTRDEVEAHYGRATIDEWQRIKDRTDPHHLLNIGVIEHLD
jgi:FAD/FMN-containing dehydrogenase